MWYIIFLIVGFGIGFTIGVYTPEKFSSTIKEKTMDIFNWFKGLFSKNEEPKDENPNV